VLVKAIFLGSLPKEMQDHVQQGTEFQCYQQLAARGDRIWQARQANRVNMVAAVAKDETPAGQVDIKHLEQVLAAVRFSKQQGSSKPGGPPRDGKGNQSGQAINQKLSFSLKLCERHLKYGKRARSCVDLSTCQFPKN